MWLKRCANELAENFTAIFTIHFYYTDPALVYFKTDIVYLDDDGGIKRIILALIATLSFVIRLVVLRQELFI